MPIYSYLTCVCNFSLDQVRDAQLAAGSPTGINGVWVTDAFGLPMFTDGLHLLTNAQVCAEIGGVKRRP